MADATSDLVRIDDTGTAHAVSRTASQRMRARKGTFRLMPAPAHVIFMRYVGEDGRRDEEDGAVVKLAGEITAAGTLCDIVTLVGQANWAGELVVLDGETSRSIFFDRGKVISAQSTAEGERLGEVLYQLGALTQEQVECAMAVDNKRLGDAAVDLGFLSREKLYQLMGKQCEEVVYNTLRVRDGMFYFLDRFDESRLASRHNLYASTLLMEGVRRMDELGYFRERIPSDEHVPARVAGKGEPPKESLKVYYAVDGEKSVAEVGRLCEMPLFDTTQALFQLVQSGHVAIHPPKATDPIAIVETFNVAMRKIFKAVELSGRAVELRTTLASFASSAGVYDALFMFAGPEPDGALKADRVVNNIASLAGDDALQSLAQWLFDFVSFAIFAAGSLVDKATDATLSRDVAALIAPLNRAHDDARPSMINIFVE